MDSPAFFSAVFQQQAIAEVLHPAEFVDGLVVAVACVPEIPLPDQWLPLAFAKHGQVRKPEQLDQIADALMALFKHKVGLMRQQQSLLPTQVVLPVVAEDAASVQMWCQGLLYGHGAFESVWSQAWQQMQQQQPEISARASKDLKHCLSMFTTFADIPLAIEQAKSRGNTELAKQLPAISRSLPTSLATYVSLAGELASFLPDQFEAFSQQPES